LDSINKLEWLNYSQDLVVKDYWQMKL
jgi:hypothetical protein